MDGPAVGADLRGHLIDAIVIKAGDGQVRYQACYAAFGVGLDGHKDILGIWPGSGDGEPVRFWFACLAELKNRGSRTCSSWSATG